MQKIFLAYLKKVMPVMYSTEKKYLKNYIPNVSGVIKKDFNLKSAIIIGLFQVLSLIPGVSRSGITITIARLLKFKRYDAAKISFLLSIPTLGVVSIYGLNKVISTNDYSFSLLKKSNSAEIYLETANSSSKTTYKVFLVHG